MKSATEADRKVINN